MSHYFIEDRSLKHDIKKIYYNFANNRFVFTTDAGVFSKDKVDCNRYSIKNYSPLSGTLLDMGCGYGCIGIVLLNLFAS